MQSGKDLSELYDTFWLLKQVEGSTQDMSHVVIDIEQTGITFSTPSYSLIMSFQYHLETGWRMSTQPYAQGGDSKSSTYIRDRQAANLFEDALRKSSSYESNKDGLTFFGSDHHPTMVLTALQPAGIENRKWRIAKYRGYDSPQADKDGLIDATEPAWVLFMQGRVNGTPGTGTYKLSGDELSVDAGSVYTGAFIFTQQIEAVSKAFNGDLRIEQNGDHILLRDKSGQAQILLVPSR